MRLVIAFCLLAFEVATVAATFDPPCNYFNSAAQDDTGILWTSNYSNADQIYSFDGKQWRTIPAPFPPSISKAMPISMKKMPNGSVTCIWRLSEDHAAVTTHRGTESKLLAQFAAKIPQYELKSTPLADSKNQLWITGNSANIYRINPDGTSQTYTIKAEELKEPKNAAHGWNPVNAMEDGAGRIWLWTRGGADNWASLRNVLLFDGEKMEPRSISGIKDGSSFLALTRKDNQHLYAGIMNGGLYEIDTNTFEAKQMLMPEVKKCLCLENIFMVDQDLFVVASLHVNPTLWRLRDGKWSSLIENLNRYSDFERPVYPVDRSFIFADKFSSWFIPENGPSIDLSWRSGFPMENLKGIFQFADGNFFALGNALFYGKLSFAPQAPLARIAEFKMNADWVLDAKGEAWFVLNPGKNVLYRQQEGDAIAYPVPSPLDSVQIAGIEPDTKGRIWLVPNYQPPAGGYFDSVSNKWHLFPTIEEAFASAKNDPPQFVGTRLGDYDPIYDRGHIAFRGNWSLSYYDGAKWQKWKSSEIIPGAKHTPVGKPFFNEDGQLCLNVQSSTWKLENGDWKKVPFENRFPDDPWGNIAPTVQEKDGVRVAAVAGPRSIPLQLPSNDLTNSPSSLARDNQGNYWFIWNNELYKCVDGACIRIFEKREHNPFSSSLHLQRVFVDRYGNTFFSTASSASRWFMVYPGATTPKTNIAIKTISTDSRYIQFHSNLGESPLYRWKLDDGSWQQTGEDHITLNYLSNGSHTIKAFAQDETSHLSALPAEKSFKITIDIEKQLLTLLAALSANDFSKREAAVNSLAQQAPIALPALKKARQSAMPNTRWWIDAAIQEIEDSKMRKARASEPVKN
ncbi:MAG: hypothetical protein ABI615_06945 [Chthoniobacterales bacterium]